VEGKVEVEPGWGKTGKCKLSEFSYPYSYPYLPEGKIGREGKRRDGEEFNTRALRHKGKIRLRFG